MSTAHTHTSTRDGSIAYEIRRNAAVVQFRTTVDGPVYTLPTPSFDGAYEPRNYAVAEVTPPVAPSTHARIDVLTAIDRFLALANGGKHPEFYEYTADAPGLKNTRIVMSAHGGGRSVHCFIDNLTGDVYKAAGWKAPAKGVRGNIVTGFDDVAARWDWSGHWLYLR